eukprot:4788079-Pyramimonas_sp.AAC.1
MSSTQGNPSLPQTTALAQGLHAREKNALVFVQQTDPQCPGVDVSQSIGRKVRMARGILGRRYVPTITTSTKMFLLQKPMRILSA